MKVLQISASFPKGSGNIYVDLARDLQKAGHAVTVVTADAKASADDLCPHDENGVTVLRVKTPGIFNVGKIQKGISFLLLPHFLKRAIRRHLSGKNFDLILFQSPPLTLYEVARWCMRRWGKPSFLMQKDIFPQSGIDLGFFKPHGPTALFFRRMEKRMLRGATYVGCTSQNNIDYLRAHNPQVPAERFLYFPNTSSWKPLSDRGADKARFRKKHAIPPAACLFLFAGNLGKPQHLEMLQGALSHFSGRADMFFAVVGGGTEQARMRAFIEEGRFANARFFDYLPKDEYDALAACCDVGIISLDPRFTVPNNPAKTLSYMEMALPIAASTDTATDLPQLLHDQARCGLWANATDPAAFYGVLEKLAGDPALRRELGQNGRRYFEENFTTAHSIKILEDIFGSAVPNPAPHP